MAGRSTSPSQLFDAATLRQAQEEIAAYAAGEADTCFHARLNFRPYVLLRSQPAPSIRPRLFAVDSTGAIFTVLIGAGGTLAVDARFALDSMHNATTAA